jgi:hydroxymethylpyrimidine pyrophosphatase-like HAD family hydrolase
MPARTLRCVYLDLDRTLLGRDSSLFHDGAGAFSVLGARAIEHCVRESVEVVITSGRAHDRVRDFARLFGQRSFIFEAGTGLALDGETHWETGTLRHGETTIREQVAERGFPALLQRHYDGCLAYPPRANRNRLVTHVFRGLVDVAEARALLAHAGGDDLQLIDNGRRGKSEHVYHLAPAGTGKAAGVARHRAMRGYRADECIAIGDSRADVGMAAQVGTFWLVANALAIDPSLEQIVARHPNARVAERGYGAGVHEAVTHAFEG